MVKFVQASRFANVDEDDWSVIHELSHLLLPYVQSEDAWLSEGAASYYHVVVEGEQNRDAAWYYPDPKPAARNIKNHVAFWRGVEIEK